MVLEVLNIMATTKKTTTTKKTGVAIETTPKKTTTRRKTGTTTTTGTKTTTKKTASTKTNDVAALQAQVTTLENKSQNLINVLHNEFETEVLRGPRGIAQSLEEAGLTD